MTNGYRVGIVTVTYNSTLVIAEFMQSVLAQTHREFVLYVIDNASADATLKLVSEYEDPRIIALSNQNNVGVAEGNNIGIRAALRDGCSSVMLVNNDTVFGPTLLAELINGLERQRCEIVVPKTLYFDDPSKIWSAGGYLSWFRASARHFGFNRKDDGRFDRPRQVNYNPTCCMLVKAEVFGRVGLMDPKYFVYFDDADFCLRAHRAGIRLFYIPTGRLLHKVSSLTGGDETEFVTRYCTRNHVYYVRKNFSQWQALLYLGLFQGYIFAKYLLVWKSLNRFWLAQKAFRAGLQLANM